jgi:hypothetical protein
MPEAQALRAATKTSLGSAGTGHAPGGEIVDAQHAVGEVEQQHLELFHELELAGVPAFPEHLVGVGEAGDLGALGGLTRLR